MTELQTRFTTEGLVIKEMNVGESDRLVTLFTREYGIIRAFASGAKKMNNKKGSATSALTYASFSIIKRKDTYKIYEAQTIRVFFSVGSDIERLTLSQYFCELAYKFGENGASNPEMLRLFLNSLHFLNKEKRYPPLIKAITELRLAVISGYSPNLIACDGCGKFEDDIMYFEIDGNDIGYFVAYNLRVLELSFRQLKVYIERKQKEKQAANVFLKVGNINERQALIIQYFMDNPNAMVTVKEMQDRFAVATMTARQDLTNLTQKGYLSEIALNRIKKGYIKGEKFDELILMFSSPIAIRD